MRRLNFYDREQIEHYLGLNYGVREIALAIGRNHSVVSRELKNYRAELYPYRASEAQTYALKRQKRRYKLKLLRHEKLREYVRDRITKDDWSPEQIAGRLKHHPPPEVVGLYACMETIYQYIYNEEEGEPRLYHRLRRRHPVRQKHGKRHHRTSIIPGKVSIHERPEEINMKTEFGHWESDSLVGKGHKGGASVQYERKTQLLRIHKLSGFTAAETKGVLAESIHSLPENWFRSITFDNGRESAEHQDLRHEYTIKTFHCDAYKPWQKGGVENVNGLIRQYFPKQTDFSLVTQADVYVVQEKLNSRPRKSLDYATPNELSCKQLTKLVH
jgi:transposase, IS30 family